jgi:hypothetical protein
MSQLFKECELRRFGEGQVERVVRWLDADDAVIGRVVDLGDGEQWEIVSAPDPALPACIVRRFDPEAVVGSR